MDNEIKRIRSFQLFEIAEDMLADGQSVIITVVGNSMYPFLRNKVDSVELYRESYDNIRVNDIVVGRIGKRYILHRVYKKYDDKFIMLGDGNFSTDGPYLRENLICKASAIYRKDKRISCNSLSFKFLSIVWKLLKPFRAKIFKVYFKIRGKK
jgi:hypothetical protein